jgi:hypothetical protein
LIIPRKRQAIRPGRYRSPSEIGFEIIKEIFLLNLLLKVLTFNPDNIIISGYNPIVIISYYFPQNPLYSISADRIATFFGDHKAKTAEICGRSERFSVLS